MFNNHLDREQLTNMSANDSALCVPLGRLCCAKCKLSVETDFSLFFFSVYRAQSAGLIQRQTHLAATGAAPLLEISSDSRQANFSSCLVNVLHGPCSGEIGRGRREIEYVISATSSLAHPSDTVFQSGPYDMETTQTAHRPTHYSILSEHSEHKSPPSPPQLFFFWCIRFDFLLVRCYEGCLLWLVFILLCTLLTRQCWAHKVRNSTVRASK
jgi:hypothetical protein